MITTEARKVTLHSDCLCWDCPKCSFGSVCSYDDYEPKCGDCDDQALVRSDSCFGCWEDSETNFYDALYEWRRNVGVDWRWVRISGKGMRWTRDSGELIIAFDESLKALTINGDFRIEVEMKDKSFTARRYSHDEPTGSAVFEFMMIKKDEDEA